MKVGNRARRGLGAALLLWAGAACALFFQAPTIGVAGARVASLGITSGTAEILLDVDNPNRYGLEVRGVDFALAIEDPDSDSGWRELSRGMMADTVALPSGDTVRVVLSVPFEYRAVGLALTSLLSNGSISYRVEGRAVVKGPGGEHDIPFRDRGVLEP
jgi:LEA14-like dessication related protein